VVTSSAYGPRFCETSSLCDGIACRRPRSLRGRPGHSQGFPGAVTSGPLAASVPRSRIPSERRAQNRKQRKEDNQAHKKYLLEKLDHGPASRF
jgi:hypothetical protein